MAINVVSYSERRIQHSHVLKKVTNKIPRSMREGIKHIHYIIRHFRIHTIYLVLLSWQYQGCYDELGNWYE